MLAEPRNGSPHDTGSSGITAARRRSARSDEFRRADYLDVTLAKARLARNAARRTPSEGLDPVQTKIDAKRANRLRMGNTFEAAARAWFEHWRGPRSPRHADYVLRRLKADVFPVLGREPVSEVTAPQLPAMAKHIESRGAVDIAKRALQTCGQILHYAVAHA